MRTRAVRHAGTRAATVLMLAAGLEQTLVATGQDDNVVVIRRGSQT